MDDPQFDQFGTVSLGVLLKPPTFQESRVTNQYFEHRGVLKTPPLEEAERGLANL